MTSDDELKRQWVDLSRLWIRESREGPNANRAGLLDPPVLKACGDVRGLEILDCGCGEGRFCRMMAARGAKRALGLDSCEPLIEAAEGAKGEREEYRVADVQDLSFLADASFDLAVSYLNHCDLPRWEDNAREVYRVLRDGGMFVVANLHPMRSAVGFWQKNAQGKKEHVILDDYFDESERTWKMMGAELTNFHRTLGTYVNGFLAAGFVIERIVEPTVTEENLRKYPGLDDELRVPNFIVFVLKKRISQ